MKSSKLGYGIRLGYGVTDFGQNIFLNVISFYLLNYCTDIVGLSPLYAGYGLLIGRAVDAITDPLMGYLSDRTKSRFGRRKPYMAVGAVVLFFSLIMLFSLPKGLQEIPTFLLMTFWYCLASIGYTLVNVPYCAILPELTKDYHERTMMTGWRMAFAILGTLIAAGLTQVLSLSMGWTLAVLILGIPVLLTPYITILAIKDRLKSKEVSQSKFFQEALDVFTFKPFLLAFIPWGLFMIGVTFQQSSLIYFFKYIYGDEEMLTTALLVLLGFSLVCIPLWVNLSHPLGKKKCYMIGMSLLSLVTIIIATLGQYLTPTYIYGLMGIGGVGLSTHYVIPHSLLPDVIEYDGILKGEKREGFFAAFWTFISKIGQAIGIGLVGAVLYFFGFVANTEQSLLAIVGIKMLIGPFPGIFILLGVIILGFYPISKAFYDKEILPHVELGGV